MAIAFQMRFKTSPDHHDKHLMDLVLSQEEQYQINEKFL